jgi:hypothetical protein
MFRLLIAACLLVLSIVPAYADDNYTIYPTVPGTNGL